MPDDDPLTGRDGVDTFTFGRGSGNDVVTGFTNGEDLIDLSAFRLSGFSNLTITSDTNGVTIDLTAHGGGTILLQGVDINDLDASDFIFTRLDGGGSRLDDVLQADDDGDRVDGGAGDDSITGGAGWDILIGGAGNDTASGGEGQDFIDGGEGNDVLDGGAGADVILGGAGNDTIRGGTEADNLAGHEGHDALYGDEGSDFLEGGEGNDTLDGGSGDDTLYGDGGDDTFVFGSGNGVDVIADFAAGTDLVDLSAFRGVSGFDDLEITDEPDGAVIDLSEFGGGTIKLEGISAADLSAEDFAFPGPGGLDRGHERHELGPGHERCGHDRRRQRRRLRVRSRGRRPAVRRSRGRPSLRRPDRTGRQRRNPRRVRRRLPLRRRRAGHAVRRRRRRLA